MAQRFKYETLAADGSVCCGDDRPVAGCPRCKGARVRTLSEAPDPYSAAAHRRPAHIDEALRVAASRSKYAAPDPYAALKGELR